MILRLKEAWVLVVQIFDTPLYRDWLVMNLNKICREQGFRRDECLAHWHFSS